MDFLKDLLGEDLAAQVAEKLGDKKLILNNGNFIPRERLNEAIEESKGYKAQLESLQGKVNDLEKLTGENAELKTKIEAIKSESETAKAEMENEMKKQRFNFLLDKAITENGAKNAKSVKANLDVSKISLDGDNFLGLDDQLKALKESDSYLFGETKPVGDPPKDGKNPNPKDKPKTTVQEYEDLFSKG